MAQMFNLTRILLSLKMVKRSPTPTVRPFITPTIWGHPGVQSTRQYTQQTF